jgi:hypothetical protein
MYQSPGPTIEEHLPIRGNHLFRTVMFFAFHLLVCIVVSVFAKNTRGIANGPSRATIKFLLKEGAT